MRIRDWSSDVCSSDLRERLEEKGVSYGLLSGIGRNVGYFRQTELEADILSVSLLAHANYDPHIALAFWHVYGPAHDSNIFNRRTHPGWDTRVAVITRAIAHRSEERRVEKECVGTCRSRWFPCHTK